MYIVVSGSKEYALSGICLSILPTAVLHVVLFSIHRDCDAEP